MKTIQLIGLAVVWAAATLIHAQSYKVMVNFNGQPSSPEQPGVIAQSRGGYMLTTAPDRNTDSLGVAFRVSTSRVLTVLHQFGGADGAWPIGGLTLGRNGRFYGSTAIGGANSNGTIFEMTPDGIVKTLYAFTGGAGSPPPAPIQSLYGDFYGTTSIPSTVYKIDSSGDFTLLHALPPTEGEWPYAPLVQATNYWLYGTTFDAGHNEYGTIFRFNSSGDFEVLFNFDVPYGRDPQAGLIQANDGNFYGVTLWGGAHDLGVVFKMSPSNQFTVLHSFTGGSDGSHPGVGLVEATDGYLYGGTAQGGAYGAGVLFRISMSGEFAVVHDFQASTGAGPVALIQHTNGFLYGDTNNGGSNGQGVFFRVDLGLGPFVTFLNSYGRVGDTVQILGQGFTADSQVFFNGMQAQIAAVYPTYMRVLVPAGATSGWITVTTTKGTLTSNKVFVVRQ
jgi:uncharacterized repeat protein (TIGR03803 family)